MYSKRRCEGCIPYGQGGMKILLQRLSRCVKILAPTLCFLLCCGCSKDLSRSDATELLVTNDVNLDLGKVEIESSTALQCGIQKGLWRREDLKNHLYQDH